MQPSHDKRFTLLHANPAARGSSIFEMFVRNLKLCVFGDRRVRQLIAKDLYVMVLEATVHSIVFTTASFIPSSWPGAGGPNTDTNTAFKKISKELCGGISRKEKTKVGNV